MEYFQIIFNQLFIFAVYVLIGIIAVWKKVIQEKDLNVISGIIIKITMPIMLFYNTLNGATREQFINTLPFLVLTGIMFLCLHFICFCLAKVFKLEGDKAKVYHATSMFGNVGFMGIPIMSALFPEKGMLYIALFTIVDQLLLWTLGVQLTTPGKNTRTSFSKAEQIKRMVNPSTVAIVLAVIGILVGLTLPNGVNMALEKTGNITSPLAMIYMGGLFCYTDTVDSLKQKEFYGAIIVKMLAFPICFYLAMGLFQSIGSEMRLAVTVLSAMPSMSSVAMLAKSQNSEGEYSAKEVFLSTLYSVITLPMVCLIIAN